MYIEFIEKTFYVCFEQLTKFNRKVFHEQEKFENWFLEF